MFNNSNWRTCSIKANSSCKPQQHYLLTLHGPSCPSHSGALLTDPPPPHDNTMKDWRIYHTPTETSCPRGSPAWSGARRCRCSPPLALPRPGGSPPPAPPRPGGSPARSPWRAGPPPPPRPAPPARVTVLHMGPENMEGCYTWGRKIWRDVTRRAGKCGGVLKALPVKGHIRARPRAWPLLRVSGGPPWG